MVDPSDHEVHTNPSVAYVSQSHFEYKALCQKIELFTSKNKVKKKSVSFMNIMN